VPDALLGFNRSARLSASQAAALSAVDCDVRLDNTTRQLFATDASLYQIEPIGVAFPRTAQQASSVTRTSADSNISITPRGAGTSLSGGAIGEGLIVDFSRHNRQIADLDLEKKTVHVGAGVVLDQLNAFLKPHGFCFGPDVATSSRATIGGMIANNSSGARVPVYGTTADHVVNVELVFANGGIATVGEAASFPGDDDQQLGGMRADQIADLSRAHANAINDRMPVGMLKRWPGYALDRFLRKPSTLTDIISGSEGTLAAIFSAELKISPLPQTRGLGLIFFGSVAEAMQATVQLLDLQPAAIEHIDRPLLDQTKGQLNFQSARDLLELDAKPCEAILLVEFYEDVAERLALLDQRRLGLRTKVVTRPDEMNLVWGVRKAGLSLLTGCIGPAKPVAFIEDAAVRPHDLPAYVAGLQSIIRPLGLDASYYGHAATGLLHVRPVVDLHLAEDRRKFRQIADQVSALVRQFRGSLSAEHGVGIARTEYMREQLGDELLGAMREIKDAFDPRNVMNPGKIFDDGVHHIDTHFRDNFLRPIGDGFERLTYVFKDRSFVGNLEQCNGCGGCRKDAPMMCPTFVATGEEVMSTRGRANIIRAALEQRVEGDPLRSRELDEALSNCLSCKGCTPECPSNVNLALLKAELTYARHQRDGLPLRERILSDPDLLGRLGCAMPQIANATLEFAPLRKLMERALGLSAKRSLPHYASERFDRWFTKVGTARCADRTPQRGVPTRGEVILWDDTFVRYHEPHIGKAAVKVLEALGFRAVLPTGRRCCGRPAFSQGNLDLAAKFGVHNLQILRATSAPVIFLEPSCYSMFAEDYRELGLDDADEISKRCFLFEQFVDDFLEREPAALTFNSLHKKVVIHAHCHAKSLLKPEFMARLAGRIPGADATLLNTGCCGMAGAFGMLKAKYDLSLAVAEPLTQQINQHPDAIVVASGTSCRHQVDDLMSIHPKHMAELLADALAVTLGARGLSS